MPKYGLNKWGGTCSPENSFNSTRLKNGLCESWQSHLYSTWYDHGYGKKVPRSIHPGNPFMSFDYFYNWCLKQPWIDQFKQNHELYELDKDYLGTRSGNPEFHPDTVILLTRSQNMQEMNQRTGSKGAEAMKRSRAKTICCVLCSGVEVEYESSSECSRVLGVSPSTVCLWLNGNSRTYLKYGISRIYCK